MTSIPSKVLTQNLYIVGSICSYLQFHDTVNLCFAHPFILSESKYLFNKVGISSLPVLLRKFDLDFTLLCRILAECDAVISGSFPLQCLMVCCVQSTRFSRLYKY